MSTRRLPLSSIPNAANSPLRNTHLHVKRARSYAESQREDVYGQPPPLKRQMICQGVSRPAESPSRQREARTIVHRAPAKAAATERAPRDVHFKPSEQELESLRQWQTQIRARFPKMVFYFESIPDERRARLQKQVSLLGARVEPFFSIDITHVVTTRPIPADKPANETGESGTNSQADGQPKTIDPLLLNRSVDASSMAKKVLPFETASSRRLPFQAQEDVLKRPKARNSDLLHRSREMKKKIWSLEKLQKILDTVRETDPYKSAVLGYRRGSANGCAGTKPGQNPDLLQLLQNERVHGPSDRDPTVATKELHYFKGPYIYVYDLDEQTKPIMAREYAKVADKKQGEWPQFRIASNGRCPFIEDLEEKAIREQKEKERAWENVAHKGGINRHEARTPRTVETIRVEKKANQTRLAAQSRQSGSLSKIPAAPAPDCRTQNAFISHAKGGRLLAGEPMASGLQQNSITSAIRSQMVSSTTGALGAKAGTSKEIHGLQRKVLQKASTPAVSQELSSRRIADMSHDSVQLVRSASFGKAPPRRLDVVEEESTVQSKTREQLRRAGSASASVARPKPRDPKPGYCENCQDKFDDFDDHILSRKHRKFAANDKNWDQLDKLLTELRRIPNHQHKQ